MAEQPDPNTACEHGHQRRKCPHCQNIKDEARIAQLEATLKKYGHHENNCTWRPAGRYLLETLDCTCGLNTAFRGTPDG